MFVVERDGLPTINAAHGHVWLVNDLINHRRNARVEKNNPTLDRQILLLRR